MQITVKPQNERVLYLHTLPLINKQACYHDPFDSINWKGMMTEIVPLPIMWKDTLHFLLVRPTRMSSIKRRADATETAIGLFVDQ